VDTWRDARRTTAADAIYEGFVENMRDAGLDGIVNVIRKPTAEAAEDFENESVDFVFIDGDRTWEVAQGKSWRRVALSRLHQPRGFRRRAGDRPISCIAPGGQFWRFSNLEVCQVTAIASRRR
jgi:hypothetical protein